MEEGVGAEYVGVGFEVAAALFDAGSDHGHLVEVTVDDGLVDEAPEVLGGLEFGGVGRQVDEPQAVGHPQSRFGVPSGTVEEQDDRALAAGTGFLRE